jgi:hypothetical protein
MAESESLSILKSNFEAPVSIINRSLVIKLWNVMECPSPEKETESPPSCMSVPAFRKKVSVEVAFTFHNSVSPCFSGVHFSRKTSRNHRRRRLLIPFLNKGKTLKKGKPDNRVEGQLTGVNRYNMSGERDSGSYIF